MVADLKYALRNNIYYTSSSLKSANKFFKTLFYTTEIRLVISLKQKILIRTRIIWVWLWQTLPIRFQISNTWSKLQSHGFCPVNNVGFNAQVITARFLSIFWSMSYYSMCIECSKRSWAWICMETSSFSMDFLCYCLICRKYYLWTFIR